MKKILYFLFIILGTLTFLQSCQKEAMSLDSEVRIEFNNNLFEINSKNSLNDFVKLLIAKRTIHIIESEISEAEDDLGKFNFIRAKYKENNRITTLVIPLESFAHSEQGMEMPNLFSFSVGGCTMECTAPVGCSGCDQTINQRCKSQTCNCNSPADLGGCTSSIKFDSIEE